MMHKILMTFPLAIVLMISLLNRALAEDALAEDEWEYKLSPLYLFATDIKGDTQIGSTSAPVDIKFKDAVSDLEATFTMHFEAHKGNKGILVNLSHINLAPEGELPNGAPLATDVTDNIIELAGIYRPQNNKKLEILYGLRYSSYEFEATVDPTSTATVVDEDWIDGFAGLRTNIPVSEKSTIILRGDIGAGDSDLTWSATAFFDYRINDRFSTLIGYRWLAYDLELGSGEDLFVYDVTYQGPVLAAMFSW